MASLLSDVGSALKKRGSGLFRDFMYDFGIIGQIAHKRLTKGPKKPRRGRSKKSAPVGAPQEDSAAQDLQSAFSDLGATIDDVADDVVEAAESLARELDALRYGSSREAERVDDGLPLVGGGAEQKSEGGWPNLAALAPSALSLATGGTALSTALRWGGAAMRWLPWIGGAVAIASTPDSFKMSPHMRGTLKKWRAEHGKSPTATPSATASRTGPISGTDVEKLTYEVLTKITFDAGKIRFAAPGMPARAGAAPGSPGGPGSPSPGGEGRHPADTGMSGGRAGGFERKSGPGSTSESAGKPGTQQGSPEATGKAVDSLSALEGLTTRGSPDQRAAIQQYIKDGGVNLDPSTRAWCAAAVNSALAHAGIKGTGSQMADSFRTWGAAVEGKPQKGDVMVRNSHWNGYGHVGMATGKIDEKNNRVEIIAGNAGGGYVKKSWVGMNDYTARRAIPPEQDQAATADAGQKPEATPGPPQSSAQRKIDGVPSFDEGRPPPDAPVAPASRMPPSPPSAPPPPVPDIPRTQADSAQGGDEPAPRRGRRAQRAQQQDGPERRDDGGDASFKSIFSRYTGSSLFGAQ